MTSWPPGATQRYNYPSKMNKTLAQGLKMIHGAIVCQPQDKARCPSFLHPEQPPYPIEKSSTQNPRRGGSYLCSPGLSTGKRSFSKYTAIAGFQFYIPAGKKNPLQKPVIIAICLINILSRNILSSNISSKESRNISSKIQICLFSYNMNLGETQTFSP